MHKVASFAMIASGTVSISNVAAKINLFNSISAKNVQNEPFLTISPKKTGKVGEIAKALSSANNNVSNAVYSETNQAIVEGICNKRKSVAALIAIFEKGNEFHGTEANHNSTIQNIGTKTAEVVVTSAYVSDIMGSTETASLIKTESQTASTELVAQVTLEANSAPEPIHNVLLTNKAPHLQCENQASDFETQLDKDQENDESISEVFDYEAFGKRMREELEIEREKIFGHINYFILSRLRHTLSDEFSPIVRRVEDIINSEDSMNIKVEGIKQILMPRFEDWFPAYYSSYERILPH